MLLALRAFSTPFIFFAVQFRFSFAHHVARKKFGITTLKSCNLRVIFTSLQSKMIKKPSTLSFKSILTENIDIYAYLVDIPLSTYMRLFLLYELQVS